MADSPEILKDEKLRDSYPKLNAAIRNSNEALSTANTAKTNADNAVTAANTAEQKADSVQTQFNQVVIEGDSSVEAAQARVAADGSTFTTLKERLDNRDAQLAQNAKVVRRNTYGVSTYFEKSVDFNSAYYRIPFCEITNNNVLIAGGDIRYNSSSDHDKTDIGIKRSFDFGETWEAGQIVLTNNGVVANSRKMDGTILVNRNTNRVFLFGLVFDMAEAWTEATSFVWDFVYKYSDDDGATWSNEISLKSLFSADTTIDFVWGGIGKGIQMLDDTLVLPIQIKNKNNNPYQIQSSIIYSTDGGNTWLWNGQRVPGDSSESNVVEYKQGELLLNGRSSVSVRRMFTTADLGVTWSTHETDRNTLIEPSACQGSFDKISIGDNVYGLFINPASLNERKNITLKATADFVYYYPVHILHKDLTDGYSCITNHNGKIIAAIENNGSLEVHDLTGLTLSITKEFQERKQSGVITRAYLDADGILQVTPESKIVFVHVQSSQSDTIRGIRGCKPNQELYITNYSGTYPLKFAYDTSSLAMNDYSLPSDGVYLLHVLLNFANSLTIDTVIKHNQFMVLNTSNKFAHITNVEDLSVKGGTALEANTSRTITPKQTFIVADPSAGSITLTLPALADVTNHHEIVFRKKDNSANSVTVKGNGTELIEGGNTYSINTPRESRRFVKVDDKWYVF